MSDVTEDKDCVSKKPWSEVLNRSMKLFTFNFAREGGRSVGRVVFFVLLALVALTAFSYVLNLVTGWFDFWPFNMFAEPEQKTWLDRMRDLGAVSDSPKEVWYCRWSPFC